MMVVGNARSLTYVDEPRLNDFQYETYGPNNFHPTDQDFLGLPHTGPRPSDCSC